MLSLPNLDLFVIGVVVVANVILGTIIFFHNRKSITARLFLLLVLVSSFWSVLNYFSYYLPDSPWLLWTMRLVMFLAVYQAYLFFLLMLVFPKKKFKLPKLVLYGITPFVVLVSLLTLSPFLFSEVTVSGGSPQPKVEPGMAFFALTAIPLVIGGIGLMIDKLKKADQKAKPQFKTLLLGLVLMFMTIILFNFIFAIVLNITSFIPLGAIFIFPFIIATFYAIYKHELLNARIVGTEILTFTIIILNFVEIILSNSVIEIIFRVTVLIALLVFGILFIKATTREVEHREQLQDLTEKLKAMDKKKDEFISIAAHELRTPLTAINGYVSMLIDEDVGKLPGGAIEVLDRTSLAADRMVRLINNLLDVGRIEEGRIVYKMGYVNLANVVKTVFDEFEMEAKIRNLKLTLDIQKDIKDKVHVDSDRIHEVVGNLLTNAFKYTEKGSIDVKVTNPSEGFVKVEVTDTGLGIPKSDQKKLFQKYYRSESSAGKIEGTGLGLYVMKLLVEKFGGEVGVSSVIDKGSEFWFKLPVVRSGEGKANKDNGETKSKG